MNLLSVNEYGKLFIIIKKKKIFFKSLIKFFKLKSKRNYSAQTTFQDILNDSQSCITNPSHLNDSSIISIHTGRLSFLIFQSIKISRNTIFTIF
jgi:hypothetical protein